ncbi:MAG TPA: mannosyltransferase family protein [Anaerolineaceae bacterium]|jgi:hypothetical protein|nr:mannosyltransferase family protein [Anaerolineaceae bacterium]
MRVLAAWLRRPFGAALAAFLALRLLSSGLAALTATLAPVWIEVEAPHDPALLAQLEEGGRMLQLLAAPWYRWDTVNYIEIAQHGYANQQNTIWPPLYPLLIRAGMGLGLHPLAAALLASNAAALGVFWLLYRLAAREWDATRARRTLLAVVIFPTAFFLVAGYSESLFLLLAVGSLSAARTRRWLLAGLLGAAATLTRHQGIFLALPLAWEGLQTLPQTRRQLPQWLIGLGLPGLAMLGYGLYIHFGLGADWPWQTLSAGWNQHLGWPWEGMIGNLRALLAGAPVGGGTLFFNLTLALLSIGMLIAGARRLPVSHSLLGWALLLSVLVKVQNDGLLGATARYALLIFPIFFVLGGLLKLRWVRLVWGLVSLLSQALLLAAFYWWAWVP